MIPSWRAIQKTNFTHWEELLHFLKADSSVQAHVLKNPKFPLNLPRRLAEKIDKNTLNDPVLKQFLPLKDELKQVSSFCLDPVSDQLFRKERKLLHKYEGRALLLVTSACAMHCRYCFRQNFDYETESKSFTEELKIIANDPSLSEILLSGGDPLSLSDSALETLISQIEAIPHIKRLRFHTRFPIGIPERITTDLLRIFEKTRLQIVFIVHSNHAKEWDEEILQAMKHIRKLGIPVLCQSVLLRGINDDLATLKELYELLINQGILPYYLYQLDKVQGSAHFEVEEEKGKELMRSLAAILPGYALPTYAKELPGATSKTLLT